MEFGQVHRIEYYVNDLQRSNLFWNWFLERLSYTKYSEWPSGISWKHNNGTYLVFCQVSKEHLVANNSRQGNVLNHIAFMGGSLEDLGQLQSALEARQIKILKRNNNYLCFEDPNEFAVELYAKKNDQIVTGAI